MNSLRGNMRNLNMATGVALLILPILISCTGGGNPSESDARKVFENQLGDNYKNGHIKLNYFKKTNGMMQEVMGMKVYTLDYEVEMKYPNGLNTQCIREDGRFAGWHCWMVETHKVGEKLQQNGSITFTLTENGWKGSDNEIY